MNYPSPIGAWIQYYFFKLLPPLSLFASPGSSAVLQATRFSLIPHNPLFHSFHIYQNQKQKRTKTKTHSLSLSLWMKEWENQKDFIFRTTFSDSIRYFLISHSKCPFCFVGSYHIYSILILFLCVYWFWGSKLHFATWVLINFLVWFNFDSFSLKWLLLLCLLLDFIIGSV